MGAGTRPIAHVVEHVGDTTAEGDHDDKESEKEHADILHHHVDAEDDWSEVFGSYANLNVYVKGV